MEKSFFFNAKKTGDTYDRVYKAEEFASYFAEFIGNGVYPNPSTGLQVVENDEPGMTTVLKPGAAFINGYGYKNTGDIVFTHKVADGVMNRKDAIFIRFDNAGRAISAIKMEGNPGAEAVVPKIVRTADYFDLCVAVISINAGITKITQDLIEDTRMDTEVCGIVHAVVEQIDTTTLYRQVQTDLANFKSVSEADFAAWSEEQKQAFIAWFEDINSKLGEEPATSLQQQINDINPDGIKADIFKYYSHIYKATFRFDGWTDADEGEKANGYLYTQTVSAECTTGGPALSPEMKMSSGIMYNDEYPVETKEKLKEAASIVNDGKKVFGDGQITCFVAEKPTADAEVFFKAMKGGA